MLFVLVVSYTPADTEKVKVSLETLETLAERGHVESAFLLGSIYYNGDGVVVNFPLALKWLRKAADANHAGAQFLLGLMYAEGHGVRRNLDTTVKWFDKATRKQVRHN
jgi:TPR repeat protein